MLMFHSSDWGTERAALTQLSVAHKRGRVVFWAAEAESRAMSMQSERRVMFSHKGSKDHVLTFWNISRISHNSLLLKRIHRHHLNGVYVLWVQTSSRASDKHILRQRPELERLHIRVLAILASQVKFGFWFPELLMEVWSHKERN